MDEFLPYLTDGTWLTQQQRVIALSVVLFIALIGLGLVVYFSRSKVRLKLPRKHRPGRRRITPHN